MTKQARVIYRSEVIGGGYCCMYVLIIEPRKPRCVLLPSMYDTAIHVNVSTKNE